MGIFDYILTYISVTPAIYARAVTLRGRRAVDSKGAAAVIGRALEGGTLGSAPRNAEREPFPASREPLTDGLLFKWIINNGYPDYLQILCLNCNKAKGSYGKCPHEFENSSM